MTVLHSKLRMPGKRESCITRLLGVTRQGGQVMRLENVQQIILDEQDLKKAAANGGLRIQVPADTTQVVIRLAQLSAAEVDRSRTA